MTQIAHDHEGLATRTKPRRLGILLAASLLVASGVLFGSVPSRADEGGGAGAGGADARGDESGADHDGIYQAQRGEPACDSRDACGEAVSASHPGGLPRRR
jgi:hypothetical protein